MANFFPRWTNFLPLKIAICAGALAGGAVLAFTYYATPKTLAAGYQPSQPIPFSHKIHVDQLGLDCRYCHSFVDVSGTSNVPGNNTCWNCHQHVAKDSPKLQPLRDRIDHTLKHADFGKTAATFVNVTSGVSTRVAARDSARALARQRVPAVMDPRQAQMVAYRDMPEGDLLTLERVVVDAAWLTRRRVRVPCAACGEHVNYEREVQVGGRTLCRGCAGERYYRRYEPRHIAPAEVRAS